MGGERPKWISSIINIFKKPKEEVFVPRRQGSRFVKNTEIVVNQGKVSVDELHVELTDDMPDDFARVLAHSFRTRKTVSGTYDPETGRFTMEEHN